MEHIRDCGISFAKRKNSDQDNFVSILQEHLAFLFRKQAHEAQIQQNMFKQS